MYLLYFLKAWIAKIDEGGNDKYRGKTSAQGTGHVGGVLRDIGGSKDG